MPRAVAFVCLAALLALAAPRAGTLGARSAFADAPQLMLWAWERPEDLRALGPNAGVAFLAQTITVRGSAIDTSPRRQPLRVDPAAFLIAVTRIEVARAGDASPDLAAVDETAHAIARTAALPRVAGLQIDFDATRSQRAFYRALLSRIRQDVGSLPLSITALASWCMDDRWIEDLPIDEAVPMLFRMGPDWSPARRADAPRLVRSPRCRDALGLSLDEPLDVRAGRRRVYVFNPHPWTAASVAAARRQVSP